jgi:hypothetical protein
MRGGWVRGGRELRQGGVGDRSLTLLPLLPPALTFAPNRSLIVCGPPTTPPTPTRQSSIAQPPPFSFVGKAWVTISSGSLWVRRPRGEEARWGGKETR